MKWTKEHAKFLEEEIRRIDYLALASAELARREVLWSIRTVLLNLRRPEES